jgi:hypothetical protein
LSTGGADTAASMLLEQAPANTTEELMLFSTASSTPSVEEFSCSTPKSKDLLYNNNTTVHTTAKFLLTFFASCYDSGDYEHSNRQYKVTLSPAVFSRRQVPWYKKILADPQFILLLASKIDFQKKHLPNYGYHFEQWRERCREYFLKCMPFHLEINGDVDLQKLYDHTPATGLCCYIAARQAYLRAQDGEEASDPSTTFNKYIPKGTEDRQAFFDELESLAKNDDGLFEDKFFRALNSSICQLEFLQEKINNIKATKIDVLADNHKTLPKNCWGDDFVLKCYFTQGPTAPQHAFPVALFSTVYESDSTSGLSLQLSLPISERSYGVSCKYGQVLNDFLSLENHNNYLCYDGSHYFPFDMPQHIKEKIIAGANALLEHLVQWFTETRIVEKDLTAMGQVCKYLLDGASPSIFYKNSSGTISDTEGAVITIQPDVNAEAQLSSFDNAAMGLNDSVQDHILLRSSVVLKIGNKKFPSDYELRLLHELVYKALQHK